MIPPALIENPKIFPICPRKMLIATPFKYPTRIGFDKKSASAPSRKKLAPMQNNPAKSASATDNDQYNSASFPAIGATDAAIIAQAAASGLTMSCRDVPKIAYATNGRMHEYNPASGLNPASCAYATATGSATAATDTPARKSNLKSREN